MRNVAMTGSVLAACGLFCSLAIGQAQPGKPGANVAPPPEAQTPVGAQADLKPTQGNKASGTLSLTPDKMGVHVAGTIGGLKPGAEHGFHVHETGNCSAPDASSAGGHFNPAGAPHGKPGPGPHHLGDMPSIKANDNGVAEVDVHISGVTLGTSQANDIAGKALVVHEKPDDYKSQPAGNSGNRIACGVIK